jgi:hypothetical protein
MSALSLGTSEANILISSPSPHPTSSDNNNISSSIGSTSSSNNTSPEGQQQTAATAVPRRKQAKPQRIDEDSKDRADSGGTLEALKRNR